MWPVIRLIFALLVFFCSAECAEMSVTLEGGGSNIEGAAKILSLYQVPSPLVESSAYYEELLERFGNAFNDHAADELASMMCENAVFRQSSGGGDAPAGGEVLGRAAIRKAFSGTFDSFPDAQWAARGLSFVSKIEGATGANKDGKWRGVSEWTFIGKRAVDGAQFYVNGVDIFTFRDGLIATKDAYRKDIPPKLPI